MQGSLVVPYLHEIGIDPDRLDANERAQVVCRNLWLELSNVTTEARAGGYGGVDVGSCSSFCTPV